MNFDHKKRQISYRTSKLKYIYRKNGVCELYDLENDPLETKNVLEQEVEKTQEFRSKILEHIKMEDAFRKTAHCEEMKIDKGIEKLKLLDRIRFAKYMHNLESNCTFRGEVQADTFKFLFSDRSL